MACYRKLKMRKNNVYIRIHRIAYSLTLFLAIIS